MKVKIKESIYNVYSSLQPGYIYEGKGQSSGINTNTSAAITSVYQSVFGSKTKYAGLLYLGLDQSEIAQKLLEVVTFCSFIIELENTTVFISCISKITISNTNKVSHNYAASLFINTEGQIVAEYKDILSNSVWNKTGFLKSILGDTLFVINHPITLDRVNQACQEYFSHQLPKCTPSDWNNEIIIKKLYELHLKRNIKRSERNLQAWHIMLCATGCTNIIPYDKDVYCCEFWTNVPDPKKDHATIAKLYEKDF
ncbi:hypothetical protein C1645_837437 [Glomus cerebriforme]|uniref:Uncharacterized protein n=1 Tax=Glomus cerebriforme TaxID=658196 RepID=A0A397S414_9GLOM|nr:hypothetical protein C1645_837437 [Glomus cerebriforme]